MALAFFTRFALKPVIGEASPFLVFTPAVMLAAFSAGPAAGLVATGFSAVLGSHFFLRAVGEPLVERWDRVALFLLVGVLITTLTTVVRTTRQRLSESLWREQKARAEAESANRAKDEFLALISHDLRTPASVVLGWASLIRSRPLSGEALGRALAAIERNARVQSTLVEDILDTSRITTGKLRIERETVDLREIVSLAIEETRVRMTGPHLAFDAESKECWVLADPVRLQQVFANLLSNAMKFTPAGGCVTVTLTRTRNHARVTVRDTGAGITAEFLPRIFERFAQSTQTLAATPGGLGLGLFICRHIIEAHDGTIAAASDGPGTGTSMSVRLPLESKETVTDLQEPAPDASAAHLSALRPRVEPDEQARRWPGHSIH